MYVSRLHSAKLPSRLYSSLTEEVLIYLDLFPLLFLLSLDTYLLSANERFEIRTLSSFKMSHMLQIW